MGGAGLACPPLACSFTKPVISFAMFYDLIGDSAIHLRVNDSQVTTPERDLQSFLI
jgi:hypothetical protein